MQTNTGACATAKTKTDREGRLPPGQVFTERFPALHYGAVPSFDEQNWDLRVFGEVEQETCWSWEEFCRLPRTRVTMDIRCVTKWSKFDTEWEGVSLGELVDVALVRPRPGAATMVHRCELGYTTNVPLEVALGDNFLLATHFGGEPLTSEHGFPLRAVCGAIPNRDELEDVYFWKRGKWLRGLEFLADDEPGFWGRSGYHNRGRVWEQERFS